MFQELIDGDAVLARADAGICFAHVEDLLKALRKRDAELSKRADGRLLTFVWSEHSRDGKFLVEWDRSSGLLRMYDVEGHLVLDWSVGMEVLRKLHDHRLGYFPIMWTMVGNEAEVADAARRLEGLAANDSEVLGVRSVEELQVADYLEEPRWLSEHVLCYGSVQLWSDWRG